MASPPDDRRDDTPPPITTDSRVRFHHHFRRREGEEYVVGRPDLSVYLSVPHVGADAMRLLEQGLTVGEASRRLIDEDGETPDVADFVQELTRYGLVAEIDGRPVDPGPSSRDRRGRRAVLAWLRPELVQWSVSPPALALTALAVVFAVIVLVRFPEHLPKGRDMFVHPWYALNSAIVIVTAWSFVLLHELGHVLAARARGLRSSLHISNRLFFLTGETDLGEVWQLPRRGRAVVYLAGLAVNVWVFTAALALVVWARPALSPFAYAWLKLLLVLEFLATQWQFLFYMKTDIYFVLADLFHAKNLMGDAQAYLRALVSPLGRGNPAADPLSAVPSGERRFVKLYAAFYVLGVGLAVGMFGLYLIPFIVRTIAGSIATLGQGPAAGIARLVDAAVALVVYGVSYGLVLRSWWRERTRRTRELAVS